jgi:FkbM family methyltransferase
MSDFAPYIVRKVMGATTFSFVIGDIVAQGWYDNPRGSIIRAQDASGLPFRGDRLIAVGWPEMDILREHIALPGSRLIECGSHHGLTAILLAAWVGPNGFVHTFDAVLENVAIVKRNLALNKIGNAVAYCAAISGKFGILDMVGESNVITKKTGLPNANSTLAVKVSSFFDGPPDAIKIDIEGAELAMLEAEREWVAKIPRLAIEVHTDYLPADGIPRLLAALGDRPLHVLWSEKELRPYAGEPITERVHLFSW